MKNIPLISIAIASYNYAPYLLRAFDAIKTQKFDDIEIIYCDDCSQDNSVEVIKKIINDNPHMNIRLIQNDINLGIQETKTKLIYACTGQYIMLCDADDWMAEDCLITLAEVVKRNYPDRVITEVFDINQKGDIIQIQDIPENASKWLWNLHHGCLYKRDILTSNQIEIKGNPDDVYLTTKINPFCSNVEWIRKPLYYWYVHDDSAGRKMDTDKQREKVCTEFEDTIKYIDDTEVQQQELEYLELLVLKMYFLTIYHMLRDFSLGDKWKIYKKLNQTIRKYHPKYWDNSILKTQAKEAPLRKYSFVIIKYSVLLERMHLMCPALLGYHILSKFIYFDQ